MKLAKISTLFGAGILALSLASLPASAQSGTTTTPGGDSTIAPSTTTNTSPTGTETAATDYRADDGFDWGWLGLIGLAGLAGLKGKDRDERVTYRDPATRETTFRE